MSGRADYYAPGDWNAACAQCGRKRKASTMRQLPKGVPGGGLYVCFPEHWDARHPQDFVRGVPEREAAPWTQEQVDTFQQFCTPNTQSAIPGAAIPGCAYPGYISPAYNEESDV